MQHESLFSETAKLWKDSLGIVEFTSILIQKVVFVWLSFNYLSHSVVNFSVLLKNIYRLLFYFKGIFEGGAERISLMLFSIIIQKNHLHFRNFTDKIMNCLFIVVHYFDSRKGAFLGTNLVFIVYSYKPENKLKK